MDKVSQLRADLFRIWELSRSTPNATRAPGALTKRLKGKNAVQRKMILETIVPDPVLVEIGVISERSAETIKSILGGFDKKDLLGDAERLAADMARIHVAPMDLRSGVVDERRGPLLGVAEAFIAGIYLSSNIAGGSLDVVFDLMEWTLAWDRATVAGDVSEITRLSFSLLSLRHLLSVERDEALARQTQGGRRTRNGEEGSQEAEVPAAI